MRFSSIPRGLINYVFFHRNPAPEFLNVEFLNVETGCTPPSQERWFAANITRTSCPWVFARGEPFRPIAASELLGTLLCWLAIGKDTSHKGPGMSFSGSTDNKGNAHVIDRLLTTKFPLCAILMELSDDPGLPSRSTGYHAAACRTRRPTS